MKTKLLRRLRRKARRNIKIEYTTPDYLYIMLYIFPNNKLYWYEQSEEFLVGYNSIEKEIAFDEYKKAIRKFILDYIERLRTKQLNKQLRCNRLNH